MGCSLQGEFHRAPASSQPLMSNGKSPGPCSLQEMGQGPERTCVFWSWFVLLSLDKRRKSRRAQQRGGLRQNSQVGQAQGSLCSIWALRAEPSKRGFGWGLLGYPLSPPCTRRPESAAGRFGKTRTPQLHQPGVQSLHGMTSDPPASWGFWVSYFWCGGVGGSGAAGWGP